MHILAVSLNYKTAPVEIREQLTFQPDQLGEALRVLKGKKAY